MAIWPFIISRYPRQQVSDDVINHEKIHFKQQLELLFVVFFVWYVLEFLLQFIRLKDRHKAYLAISFEREAYHFQKDMGYLKRRKYFAWFYYYFRHAEEN